jgi:hypothetical protein
MTQLTYCTVASVQSISVPSPSQDQTVLLPNWFRFNKPWGRDPFTAPDRFIHLHQIPYSISMAHMDLSDVGKSNRIYSDEEAHVISLRLKEAQEHLHQIMLNSPAITPCKKDSKRRRIAPGKAEIEEQMILDRIAGYMVALAPHKKLPEDILRIIFTFSSPTIVFDRNTRAPRDFTQVILTQVSSQWRRIALDTVDLWNDYTLEEVSSLSEYLFTVLFPRARNSLISLIGHFSVGYNRKLICQLSMYRFRSLFLFLDNKQFSLLRSQFQLNDLTTLGLVHDDKYQAPNVTLNLHPDDLPNLNSLTLRLPISTLESTITSFPWKQLTVLNLKDENWEAIPCRIALNILRECVLLQGCKIYVRDDTPSVPRRDVVLPHLQALYLEMSGSEDCFEKSFGMLVLPRLHTLCISGIPSCWSMPAFSRVAERSGFHQLLDLRIHGFSGTVPLCQVLDLLPGLNTLWVGMGDITDEVYPRLSKGQLCPRLLTIASHTNEVDVMERLLDVVEDRLDQTNGNANVGDGPTVQPFRRIIFHTDYTSVIRALEDGRMDKGRLERLKERGVEIRCGLFNPGHIFHI